MRVRDIMTTDLTTVREDTPVREIAQLLDRRRISGAPVCDEQGHLIGVVSEYDLLAKPDARTAAEVMSRDVVAVLEDTELDEVRYLLVTRKIKRVPVLRGQKLVGIVSRADLVREIGLTWICQVCGDRQRGPAPPQTCPKCGVPSGYQPGEEPDAAAQETCPACGRPL